MKQIHNLYTNYEGSYCSHIKREKMEGHIIEEPYCPDSMFLRLSLANKLEYFMKILIIVIEKTLK